MICKTFNNYFKSLLTMVFLSSISIVYAQDMPDKSDAGNGNTEITDDVVELSPIEQEIETEITTRATITIEGDKEAIARAQKIGWPIPKTKKSQKEIKKDINNIARRYASKRYPASKYKKFKSDAAKKYRLFEIGEQVEFVIRHGQGINTRVKGKLLEKDRSMVKIGSRYISRLDISSKDQAHFFKDVSDKKRQEYVARKSKLYNSERQTFQQDFAKKIEPKLYNKYGYLFDAVSNQYLSQSTIFEKSVRLAIEDEKERIRDEVTREIYTKAGYVNENGNWIKKKKTKAKKSSKKKKGIFGLFK